MYLLYTDVLLYVTISVSLFYYERKRQTEGRTTDTVSRAKYEVDG